MTAPGEARAGGGRPAEADRTGPGASAAGDGVPDEGTSGGDTFDLPAGVGEAVRAAVHAEFDEVLHYVVEALRRNNAFEELNDRLRTAERRLDARRERPIVVAIYNVLDRLRHFDFDEAAKSALEADIVKLLNDAGFQETGQVGEEYDPDRHEAIEGRGVDGRATVTQVHTRGLSTFDDVVFRARVEISPQPARRCWPYAADQRQSADGSVQ
jgi:molecular chaperone GrpE (heat shock protein)